MIITAIILAIICAVIDKMFGIPDPWRKIVYAGVVVLFIVGLVMLVLGGGIGPRLSWF